ncbi:CAP domain-containing protein [Halobacillus karajensis]|uniref:Cysteine-rich secretory protein family protein n=1 Tax=Halobacillus karajensis TaxID=195088 RepID=A0A059NZ50_9BACI|nr:CAP domain-containing protein [Halobacillus karajensis]CDQ18646.1 Cysteine-rich secretory protein family protein [Halobacillus karajensis]CDQ23282.1 Cysteine-rich secretory protein family protein [Halobacillus karajensis]CDQ26764.1 Cysteine-rich secretory protein family protein [Halobacillus karajensis]
MIKKLILFLAALFVIIIIGTPVSAQDLWKEGPRESYEKVSQHVQGWVENTDIKNEFQNFAVDLDSFFETLEGIEWKYPDQSSKEQSDAGNQEEQVSEGALGDYELKEFEEEVVSLVNEERKERGLAPLETHHRLSALANVKSQDMSDKRYFSHTSPTYGSPFDMMDEFDFRYRTAGENIAAGQRTPEEVVEGWMNSEGHRKNILHEDFTHIGVGYIEGSGPYKRYWTQLFMTPR